MLTAHIVDTATFFRSDVRRLSSFFMCSDSLRLLIFHRRYVFYLSVMSCRVSPAPLPPLLLLMQSTHAFLGAAPPNPYFFRCCRLMLLVVSPLSPAPLFLVTSRHVSLPPPHAFILLVLLAHTNYALLSSAPHPPPFAGAVDSCMPLLGSFVAAAAKPAAAGVRGDCDVAGGVR